MILTVSWTLTACDATIHEYPSTSEPMPQQRAVRVVAVDAAEPWRQYKQVRLAADGTVSVTDLAGALCENEEKNHDSGV